MIKTAILIDGGYLLKRLPLVRPDVDATDPDAVAQSVNLLVRGHLKSQAEMIVLVSADADFVPAAKLARREGVQFVLDPLWQQVSPDLLEHIDGLRSGFYKPRRDSTRVQDSRTLNRP